MEHELAYEYKWSLNEIKEMDLYEVFSHFLRMKERKKADATEELIRLKMMVYAIHGDPQQTISSLEDTIKSEETMSFDDEVGDIEKQKRRRGQL